MMIQAKLMMTALWLATAALGQGVQLKRSATVLFGAPSLSSRPAEVSLATLRKVTPEWQTIRSEGVREQSARHSVLMNAMMARIRRACASVARAEDRDSVVEAGSIVDRRGLEVADLTPRVRRVLRSEADRSVVSAAPQLTKPFVDSER